MSAWPPPNPSERVISPALDRAMRNRDEINRRLMVFKMATASKVTRRGYDYDEDGLL